MKFFQGGQKVRVVAKDHELKGKTGTVSRVSIRDSAEAWVTMDQDLPPTLRSFSDDRKNDIILNAEDCEALS